jgi:hypothetical protein
VSEIAPGSLAYDYTNLSLSYGGEFIINSCNDWGMHAVRFGWDSGGLPSVIDHMTAKFMLGNQSGLASFPGTH